MIQRIVKLEDGEDGAKRTLTVRELRFKDAIKVASNYKELFSDFAVEDLQGEKFELFKDLIAGIVTFPKDESIEDLYFSELTILFNTFKEVNESFLELTNYLGIGRQVLDEAVDEVMLEEPPETPSTELPQD